MGGTYTGTNGDDRFVQGSESEVTVKALGGNDEIILNLIDDDLGGFNFVDAGSGNDLVDNRYEGGNNIVLGAGNDTYIGTGFALSSGAPYDVVSAGDGDDRFTISTFNSRYYGEAGNDTFNSEGWQNLFDGGSGVDTVSYALRDSVDTTGVTVDLDREFAQTGASRTEKLFSIENAIGTNFADTIFGSVVDNTLSGRVGNDELVGLSGNDIVDGGTGADRMFGGAGNDIYIVDNAGDIINEVTDHASGTDTVNSSVSFSLVAGSQLAGNVENLTLIGNGAINGTGNAFNNALIGGTGANVLNGGAGADYMAGGAGNDTYYVDNAGDQTIEANDAGSDKVFSSVSYSVSRQFIENVYLTGSSHINATGNNLANEIVGNTGNNVINGGAGADRMVGGLGNDTYYVDNAGDVIAEANGAGSDKVFSSISYSIATQNVENMYLTGSGNLSAAGNNLANGIVGNAGNNVLNGGLGSDYLVGGAGNDFFTFNTALGASNVDTISDFNVAQDTIRVDNAIFTALGGAGALAASAFHIGASAHDANDRIIYNSTTGALFYDSNGSAAGGETQFATLSKGLAMTNADFLIV